jgi:hypothetical protein
MEVLTRHVAVPKHHEVRFSAGEPFWGPRRVAKRPKRLRFLQVPSVRTVAGVPAPRPTARTLRSSFMLYPMQLCLAGGRPRPTSFSRTYTLKLSPNLNGLRRSVPHCSCRFRCRTHGHVACAKCTSSLAGSWKGSRCGYLADGFPPRHESIVRRQSDVMVSP